MNTFFIKRAFAAALLIATAFAVQASDTVTDPARPHALPDDGPVAVSWSDPALFSDLKYSGNRWQAQQGDWVDELATYFRKRASRQLQPGEKLEVTITDIMRAGQYEPWRGPRMDDIRFINERYPPRIDFNYTLTGADGQVIAQGSKQLRDASFMMSTPPINSGDPLRYEKQMIDNWTRRGLRGTDATASN